MVRAIPAPGRLWRRHSRVNFIRDLCVSCGQIYSGWELRLRRRRASRVKRGAREERGGALLALHPPRPLRFQGREPLIQARAALPFFRA